jgi:hypothetical protein
LNPLRGILKLIHQRRGVELLIHILYIPRAKNKSPNLPHPHLHTHTPPKQKRRRRRRRRKKKA